MVEDQKNLKAIFNTSEQYDIKTALQNIVNLKYTLKK